MVGVSIDEFEQVRAGVPTHSFVDEQSEAENEFKHWTVMMTAISFGIVTFAQFCTMIFFFV